MPSTDVIRVKNRVESIKQTESTELGVERKCGITLLHGY